MLNTIVCTEPEDVPIHKVGKALESATEKKNILYFKNFIAIFKSIQMCARKTKTKENSPLFFV